MTFRNHCLLALSLWFWPASDAAAIGNNAYCPADLNGDGSTLPQDIFLFLEQFYSHATSADFDGDNTVDIEDLNAFLSTWLAGCVAGSQCSDGIDNNQDGFIDFPLDAGCASRGDPGEGELIVARKTTYSFAEWYSFHPLFGHAPYAEPLVPPTVTHNVQYPWVVYPENHDTLNPSLINQYFSHLPPDVPRAMFSWGLEVGIPVNDPRYNDRNDPHYRAGFDPADDYPNGIPSPYQSSWLTNVHRRASDFFRNYKNSGGRLDIFNMDAEYFGPNFDRAMIASDPRIFQPNTHALIQPGDFLYTPLATLMGNLDMLSSNCANNRECNGYWNLLVWDWSTAYLNKGIYDPLRQFFPAATVSNFNLLHNDFENYWAPVFSGLTRCTPGYYCSTGSTFGNAQEMGIFYGWNVPGGGTIPLDGTTNPYLKTPFNHLKYTINWVKQAALSAPAKSVTPTFASRQVYRTEEVNPPSVDYYREGVFHVFLAGAPHAFLWTENRYRFIDDYPLSEAMDEFDRISGYADRKTTFTKDTRWLNGMRTNIDRSSWADDFVLTCNRAGGPGREVCRITPELIPAGGGLPALTVASFLLGETDAEGNPHLTFRSRQKQIEIPGGVIWRPTNPSTVSDLGYWFVKPIGTPLRFSPSGLNTPPTARITLYQTGVWSYDVLVNASHSSDPGGQVVRYSYDFNGDGIFGDGVITNGHDYGDIHNYPNANPGFFQYTFGQPGTYTIAVRVTDNQGASTTVRTPPFTLSSARPLCRPEFNIYHIPPECLLTSAVQEP